MPVASQPQAKKIAFCLSARTGLGHLRRVTNIAMQVQRLAPGTELAMLMNATPTALSDAERSAFSQIIVAERDEMARRLAEIRPDVVAVDTAVIPRLEFLAQPLVLIVREMPAQRVARFRLPNHRLWERAIVAAPANEWTVEPGAIGAQGVENVGWIYRTPRQASDLLVRQGSERIVLVATGGGGGMDRALSAEISLVLEQLKSACGDTVRIVQALGPRAPRDAGLAGVDEIIDVGSRLDEAFATADVVISTAGYNSVLELASTTTPTVLVAIARTYDDQSVRAQAWAGRLGLAHELGQPERTASWIEKIVLSGERRAPAPLGGSGDAAAARALLTLLNQRTVTASSFVKTTRKAAARASVVRSHALFRENVATPPGVAMSHKGDVAFAFMGEQTARNLWQEATRAVPPGPLSLLDGIAAALCSIHDANVADLVLPQYDPWQKIVPRIAGGDTPAIDNLGATRIRKLVRLITELRCAAPARNRSGAQAAIHGDFHLGQLIAAEAPGTFSVVDLDDMARGDREADVGNFIAHIVTSPDLHGGVALLGFLDLMHQFTAAYARASGRMLMPTLVHYYGAIALLRRLLKRAEQGDVAAADYALNAAACLMQLAGATPGVARMDEVHVRGATASGLVRAIAER